MRHNVFLIVRVSLLPKTCLIVVLLKELRSSKMTANPDSIEKNIVPEVGFVCRREKILFTSLYPPRGYRVM